MQVSKGVRTFISFGSVQSLNRCGKQGCKNLSKLDFTLVSLFSRNAANDIFLSSILIHCIHLENYVWQSPCPQYVTVTENKWKYIHISNNFNITTLIF